MSGPDVVFAPRMRTLPEGFLVKTPEGALAPPQIGPGGGISVGATHISGGPLMLLALHKPDGETLVAMFGSAGFRALALAMNDIAERIEKGEFNQPELCQIINEHKPVSRPLAEALGFRLRWERIAEDEHPPPG